MTDAALTAWVDASAGVAGDMMLGALLDAGADLARVSAMVDAVVPGAVRLGVREVARAGLRASKADVRVLVVDPPHRTWRSIRGMLADAALPAQVRDRAVAVFGRLAAAEARVHGIPEQDVHFHEVGALDAIADVVGVCAALSDLGIDRIVVGEIAVGSGRVGAEHGVLPVPVPAVAELARGWRVISGGSGERATPTGMALVTTLAVESADLPAMSVQRVGVGAGSRDTPGAPNVVRVVLGRESVPVEPGEPMVVLEAGVDDLDPRLWPGVLAALLDGGAADAWLTPIVMKKGRPAHLLSVLGRTGQAAALRDIVFRHTTTIGIRQATWRRFALPRAFGSVTVAGGPVAIKIAHRDGVIVRATPEFDDVASRAKDAGLPVGDVLSLAIAAADAAGLRPGDRIPASLVSDGEP